MKRLIICLVFFVLIFSVKVSANPTGTKKYVTNPKNVIIYVGDSRAMQMGYCNKSERRNFVFVYSNGGNLNSISPKGGSRWIGDRLQKVLRKYPKAPVVFALGVNGNGNPSANVKRTKNYDYYIRNYPSHAYFISTVGGTGKKTGSYKNSKVKTFNRLLKQKYGNNKKVHIYDCYQFLVDSNLLNPGKSNKGTKDGLHYKRNVYVKILKDCRKYVQGCS